MAVIGVYGDSLLEVLHATPHTHFLSDYKGGVASLKQLKNTPQLLQEGLKKFILLLKLSLAKTGWKLSTEGDSH